MSSAEIAEIDALISMSSFPGIISVLNNYKSSLASSAVSTTTVQEPKHGLEMENVSLPPATESELRLPPAPLPLKKATVTSSNKAASYISIADFAWDQGEYNSPTVTVYVDLPGVGTVKDSVKCEFTASSFDLIVLGLNNANYRLLKDNLDKDIVPGNSKFIVKKDKVVLKLAKVKGDYSYDHWTALTSKKTKEAKEAKKKDPMGGIMDMMKDMYDDGDENMKKIIGEAMMKSQRGEKSEPPSLGGKGGFGDGLGEDDF